MSGACFFWTKAELEILLRRRRFAKGLGLRKIDLNNFKVARSETARDINKRIVLNLIRQHQPISRAGLSRRSGLQRSTVSAITEQLISERWVIKGAAGQ